MTTTCQDTDFEAPSPAEKLAGRPARKPEIGDAVVIRTDGGRRAHYCGQIVNVQGPLEDPLYIVHWEDDTDETLFVPGRDTELIPHRTNGNGSQGPSEHRR